MIPPRIGAGVIERTRPLHRRCGRPTALSTGEGGPEGNAFVRSRRDTLAGAMVAGVVDAN